MDLIEIFSTWIKTNIGLVLMGTSGSIVGAIMFQGSNRAKLLSFIVGAIMSQCLGEPASQIFYNGQYSGVFGFFIGMSGMTLAKILHTAFINQSKSKVGINDNQQEGEK